MRAIALLLLAATAPAPVAAQLSAFRYDAARVPVGTVYYFLKSNRDGTHEARITQYVAATDRLESLKWDPGTPDATLVIATMDWPRMSVSGFENWRVASTGERTRRAALMADAATGAITFSFLPDTVVPAAWPWHSYDFDFASLSLTLPHLRRTDSAFEFQRTDIIYQGNSATFGNVGPIRMRPAGEEQRGGGRVRRWEIGGPGLLDSTGTLWTDFARGHLVEFRIPVPDEPGLTDAWLRLEGVARFTPAEWEAYVRERAAGR